MKIIELLNKIYFDRVVRAILKTPPVPVGNQKFIALSMVQSRDTLPYLLAIKSFARYMHPERIIVIADPTLSTVDRALLRSHVPHIEFREAAEFQSSEIPSGGCWERLAAIAEYSSNSYIVQLDADTVAIDYLPEVQKSMQENTSFTLGTEDVQPIISCSSAAQWATSKINMQSQNHIQVLCESNLDKIFDSSNYRYARGCAGFAGFAKDSINSEKLRYLSACFSDLVGSKWSGWGTEQFMSNLLICSSENARLLPHPKYCNPNRRKESTVFLHFIGYVRYTTNLYSKMAIKACNELMALGTK